MALAPALDPDGTSPPPLMPIGGTPVVQTLSWPPGEEAWRLLIFRGPEVVVERVTSVPRVVVELVPGEYRWVVLPLREGEVYFPAIVDSKLEIPGTTSGASPPR